MITNKANYSASIFVEYPIGARLLELVLVAVHDSDSQNELLCIVVIEDAVQVISETFQVKRKGGC